MCRIGGMNGHVLYMTGTDFKLTLLRYRYLCFWLLLDLVLVLHL